MPRFHATKDGPVQFTQQEEDARDAEEAALVSLPALKAKKKAAVTALRESKELIPVNVGGTLFSAHNGPLHRLTGAKLGGKPTRKAVTDLGVAITMSQAQVNAVFDACDDYLQGLSDREYDLYVAIDAAADQAALDAIDINSGW